MDTRTLFAFILVSLALFTGAAWAYDDSGWSDSGYGDYPYPSSGCCCAPAFVMVAGAAAFTYAHRKE